MAQNHVMQNNKQYATFESQLSSVMNSQLQEQNNFLVASKTYLDILNSKGQWFPKEVAECKALSKQRAEAFKQFDAIY